MLGFVFTGFAAFLPAITGVRVAFLPAVFVFQDWGLVAILAAFSFVHFSTQPLANTLIARFTSQQARGMSFAVGARSTSVWVRSAPGPAGS